LESYKGFNNTETCSWSGGYIAIAGSNLVSFVKREVFVGLHVLEFW